MLKKNSLLVSAAMLALLAAPALAQQHDEHNTGKAGFGRESAAAHGGPKPAPTPFPGQPGQRPPQGARPQPPQGGHPEGNRPGRPEGNRPGFDNNRPGGPQGNRPGFGNNNRPGNPGFNRPGNPGARPGGRPNYSSFRYYHQNITASRRFHAPAYRRPSGWYYRRWSYGQILPSLFWAQQYWLNDYISYDLPPPPPGAVWVRYGNDAILIDRYSGEIISIQYNVFY